MQLQIKLGSIGGFFMDRDRILALSRKENQNQDLAEIECLKQAGRIAYLVGCSVCVIISVLQWNFAKTINWGCWVVNFSILGTVFLVKFSKQKKTHALLMTILYYALCIFFLIGFITSLRG